MSWGLIRSVSREISSELVADRRASGGPGGRAASGGRASDVASHMSHCV